MTTTPMASATYIVNYTHTGSIFDSIETYIDAYSPEDAETRLRDSMRFYEVTIRRVALVGKPEPVVCTYNGPEGGDGPWQFLDYEDKWAPLLVCDVHNLPANPSVYDTATMTGPYGPEKYAGPCRFHPDLPAQPAEARR